MLTGPAGPASTRSVRQHNLGLVLAQVVAASTLDDPEVGVTRARLASGTGLTKATVSALVDELIRTRLAVELEQARGARGRPGSPVRLNPDGPCGLGVEINVDYVRAVVVDLTGRMRAGRTDVGDNRDTPAAATLRRAAMLARSVAADVPECVPAGVVFAVPGLVQHNDRVIRAPNLPRWNGRRVAGAVAGLLPWPADVDNEANLSALAELRFGGDRRQDFILVSGEIGVGAGIVMDGHLFRGVRGYAGELGHVVVDAGGPPCSCGARGCLEQVAGQEALLRGGPATVAELAARARIGNPQAEAVLERAGRALGVALAGVVNVLDVPAVVLGGRYAELGAWLGPPIRAELAERVVAPGPVDVLVSALGADAAALGAAGTVVDRVLTAAR